jgi:MarR-like DNA-binding transcriptional regulator SgrR of sgrS sRNA
MLELMIYTKLIELWHKTRHAVTTWMLANEVYYSERHVRRALRRLEDEGAVMRKQQRGGWMPVV